MESPVVGRRPTPAGGGFSDGAGGAVVVAGGLGCGEVVGSMLGVGCPPVGLGCGVLVGWVGVGVTGDVGVGCGLGLGDGLMAPGPMLPSGTWASPRMPWALARRHWSSSKSAMPSVTAAVYESGV